MRGLVPRIHDFRAESKAWMAATSAAMTGHQFNLIGKCSKPPASRVEPIHFSLDQGSAWRGLYAGAPADVPKMAKIAKPTGSKL